VILSGCGVGKTIPQGEHLLKKNSVQITGNVRATEIHAQILHRANKRVVFNKIPIYLWAYALGSKHKQPELSDSVRWRRKLRNEYGEPPVSLDSTLIQLSADNIRNYLFNTGYFDAEVGYIVRYSRKKAKVTYLVNSGDAYLINSVFMEPEDSVFKAEMWKLSQQNDYFRLWWPADLSNLSEARNFYATAFRNQGYYTITSDLFRFSLDTLHDKKEAALTMILANPPAGGRHIKYSYGSVRLRMETSSDYAGSRNPAVAYFNNKKLELNHYPINPETIAKLIYIDSGANFSQSAADKTYQSLLQTGLFSLIDIRYTVDTGTQRIETVINVKTSPRMAFSIEPQGLYSPQGTSGTNFQSSSQRSFGTAMILSFANKNWGRDAENLRVSSITSWEAIFKRDNKSGLQYGFQQGFNASISLPHFILLNSLDRHNRSLQRNTVLSLSYQYEKNPNFFRSAIPASLTFQFVQPKFSWYYTPTEVSFNRNILTPAYLAGLPEADQVFINRVFTNQFLTAAKVGLIYANNRQKPGETYIFGRAGFETSGNMHRAIRSLGSNFIRDSAYHIFGLEYFQYARIEGEVRLRQAIDELNVIALRLNSGIALPYGNSSFVPYDKRFFIGGSNSLRAWRPRRLGPGSTPDTSNLIIDRSGEFLLEGSLEYRFTLFKNFLESALFLDAGNIWNLKHKGQTAAQSSLFIPQNMFDEVALNTGIGFRFDFTFFLFRVDWGIPLRDPSKALGSRWLITKDNLIYPGKFVARETALAFGIGYPF
jgi:hypothetical protein